MSKNESNLGLIKPKLEKIQSDQELRIQKQVEDYATGFNMSRLEAIRKIFPEEAAEFSRKLPPKYQNPDNEKQKWSGRGIKPAWLVEKLEQGSSIEEFLVQ